MGLVYRALDTRLNRHVAVKILPDTFAHDPERLARFEREAKMLASLNHPNIAAIHGLEQDGGVRFLVLELVPGATLAERLARGPLSLQEALGMARQVAEGLEAAHDRGIIHRDLKPANIKVAPEGKVKVLDFGLAKGSEAERRGSDPLDSPTVTSDHTRADVILGTAAYMSPEQARGKPLDKRTDIWSFGCVLYEALTGRQTFSGETVSDCLARILERDPDWKALPASVPGRAVDLLRRCLQKDARNRLRDIGDARIEIGEILAAPRGAAGAMSPGPAARPKWQVAGGLGVLALSFALAGALVGRRAALTPAVPGAGDGPNLVEVARLTHDPGISEWPTWSPDGTTLAFVSNRDGNFDIYVRRVDGGQEVNITADPAQDFQPSFSPDGNQIAFVSTRSSRTGMIQIGATFGLEFRTFGGDLWAVPALGGQARRLARDANFPAWRPDAQGIAYVSGPENHRAILEIGPDGGTPRTVLSSDASTWEIVRVQYSPGGTWLSFETPFSEMWLMPAAGGRPRRLTVAATSHVWEASGRRLYYLSRGLEGGTRLMSVKIDEAKGELRGEARTLSWMTGVLRNLDVSKDGRRLVVSELEGSLNLTILPLKPGGGAPAGPEQILSRGQVIDRYPAFSPDGRRIAFTSDRLGPMNIWILDLETARQNRLQLPGEDLGANVPQWSPDGRSIALIRFRPGGEQSLWLAAADGSQAEELMPTILGMDVGAFSRDGRSILYEGAVDGTRQVFAFDLGSRKSRQLSSSPGDKYEPRWSPDGHFIVFVSNAGGSLQVRRMPAGGGKEEVLTQGDERMRHVSFSSDGRWIYVQPSHRNIYRFPASGGALQPITDFPESGLFIEEPTLSPDDRFLAYCRSNGGASLWLMTIAQGAAADR
ncbi:MAG: serine/threonine-protein kinase [Acidobacteria bacterium]|nr:serine/threonine-protein kinase [Acidobacteriota bacterium]